MDRYMRERVENISEEDFWSSITPSDALAPALEAAAAGKKAQAYRLLGDYHGRSLAREAELTRAFVAGNGEDAKQAAAVKRGADMVLRHEIDGWHTRVIKFGPKIDFNADFGRSGQYGFHYLGWLVPVLHQYALTGDKRYRECFLDVLGQYYAQRGKLDWRIPRLHPVYYELGSRAKIGVFFPAYAVFAGEAVPVLDHRGARTGCGHARRLVRLGHQVGLDLFDSFDDACDLFFYDLGRPFDDDRLFDDLLDDLGLAGCEHQG